MSRRVRFWLRLAAGIGLLVLILSRIDRAGLALRPTPERLLGVLLAGALLLLSQSLAALRWRLILGAPDLRWTYLTRLYVIAAFFSLLLPTAVGGDAVRAAALVRSTSRPGGVVASVIFDRLFGVAALVIYAGLGLAIANGIPPLLMRGAGWSLPRFAVPIGVAVLVVALVAVAILARRSNRVARALADAAALARSLLRAPATVFAALVLALVVQGLILLLWLVLARSLDLPIPLAVLLVAVPLVTLGSMLPITLSGLGVREGIWLLLLGGSGLAPGAIVGFSLLYFATTLLVGVVGLILFVTVGVGPPVPPDERPSPGPGQV